MTTQQQHEAYARALDRARRNRLAIVGEGHWRQGGARFLVVGSASEAGRFHLVTAWGGRLACDCEGGRHGHMCQHRALVHEALAQALAAEAERAAFVAAVDLGVQRAVAERREQDRRRHRERERERDQALLASRCDNRPFSIWKA